MSWYWLPANKEPQGPVTVQEIVELYRSKQIKDSTHFWAEGEVALWTRIRDIPQLANAITASERGGRNTHGGDPRGMPPTNVELSPIAETKRPSPQPRDYNQYEPEPSRQKQAPIQQQQQPAEPESGGLDVDKAALAKFLGGEAELDTIWVRFDRDGSGSIDHEEFFELMLTCLSMFMHSQGDSGDVPSRESLAPTVKNLCDELLPKLDKDNDGEIDREEFNHVGMYIMEEFDLLQEGDNGDLSKGRGMGLASAAQQMFAEAQEVRLLDHVKTRGKIDFFGNQILYYDSSRLVNLGVFDTLTGTVLMSVGLWTKMGFLTIIFTVGALLAEYVFQADKLEIESLEGLLVGMEALLAFFAGLYVQQVLDRWWCIRSEGIGGVCNAVTDLSLTIAGLTHDTADREEQNLRNIIVRYGLLAHALIYARAQDKLDGDEADDAWADLKERGLVTVDEEKILRPLKRKSEAVWGWIISYLHKCIEDQILPDDRLEHFTEICREGRAASSLVSLHLECQLPLPYVHLIALVINLYQVVLAFLSGMICAASWANDDQQKLILSVIVFVLYCVIYQGILETAEKMTNPLGTDDIDFPQLFIHLNMQNECKAIFETSKNLPWKN